MFRKNIPIFIVGMMGSGKTTVGCSLARKLGIKFFDLDYELEKKFGMNINCMFKIKGEIWFRNMESIFLHEMTNLGSIIVSTGGGIVRKLKNRRMIRERGKVIYLRTDTKELFRRISKNIHRPIIMDTDNKYEKIKKILYSRKKKYTEVAHIIIDTDCIPVKRIVEKIELSINKKDTF